MGGFIRGFGLGAVVVVAGGAALSLLLPLPQRPEIGHEPAQAATGAGPAADAGVETATGDADLVEAMPKAPDPETASADDLGPMENADTAPAEKPSVGAVTDMLAGPTETAPLPEVSTGADSTDLPKVPAAAPDAPGAEETVSITTDPAQPMAPAVPETDSGFGAMTEETQEDAPAEASASGDMAVASAPPAVEETAPRIAALPQVGAGDSGATAPAPSIGTPGTPLIDPAPAAVPAGTTPLEDYATPFTNPEARPLMSILLIDDARSIGAEALADFPYPLTFAIDPSAPDATEKMARYRAAGFEVVLLADLPAAATAQDAEVSMSVWRAEVPEAVAILEGTGTGFQGNRALSDQVTAIAQAAGLGLITQSKGLNTVQKLAAREGVPSAVVFRDFDGAGQTPTVMRRFLDQAAFRAGQEGAVIMLGRVRPDTISALLLWGLQDRAQRVALAPVSAVLTHVPAPAADE
ncbi:polysaccharide deacteylase family 2 protein [Pseudodonghicola flavimaris]|uniref:Divergent polysaccharide deacetylase family protein n=1 Tax=Pseudodonghicola flavimaris TaxID=3050036 RepID=A0ABT7EVR6_9RHOB|nr:polysaccharide deacteylase family 2 protein [Pseudodonghicola flavimaris]MDK3016433.1 divergent polysaccharide deacetylase family protein [Pseudodonghicola flavimaris]